AQDREMRVEEDPFGNLVAWWGEGTDAVLTGSHLDSVPDAGAYDGALGVASAFAAIDLIRARGAVPRRRLGVVSFAEKEGSRFGQACLGSRLAVGAASWTQARELTDREGTRFGDLVPGPSQGARPTVVDGVKTFVELHVEHGRGLIEHDAAVGMGDAIWPHGRFRYDFTGSTGHAGATAMADRADPMLTYAMTVLAANKQARLSGQRASFGRVEVRPNAEETIASQVSAWLDAHAGSQEALTALVAAIGRQASDRADRDGTSLAVTTEAFRSEVVFDRDLGERLRRTLAHPPVLASPASHDAGVLQTAGIEAAMLWVRNSSGVAHAPAERVEMVDARAGVEALAAVLTELSVPGSYRDGSGGCAAVPSG
ncbi:MAG: allantoate amidohydrolase, partial [Nocardioidaceae bacterium]|nr:allantoate amidohydrolase [Nocardioidaceae bacterium]